MNFAFGLLAFSLALTGCAKESVDVPSIQPHWLRATEGYLLEPRLVLRKGESDSTRLPLSSEYGVGYFEDRGVAATVSAQHYGFWLDVSNENASPVRIIWPHAAYVDENGVRRAIYAQPRGVLPDDVAQIKVPSPESLRAGEAKKITIVPIYKQYLVRNGNDGVIPYSEPLIPTTLSDKDETAMREYVRDLAVKSVPVKLVLPIEMSGTEVVYILEFSLVRAWSSP